MDRGAWWAAVHEVAENQTQLSDSADKHELNYLKKKDIFPIFNNMDGPGGHYAKRNKSEKAKYCLISLICRSQKNKAHW